MRARSIQPNATLLHARQRLRFPQRRPPQRLIILIGVLPLGTASLTATASLRPTGRTHMLTAIVVRSCPFSFSPTENIDRTVTTRCASLGTLTARMDGFLEVVAFRTENSFDQVTVHGQQYSGSGTPAFDGSAMATNETVGWYSDGSNAYDGWKFCLGPHHHLIT